MSAEEPAAAALLRDVAALQRPDGSWPLDERLAEAVGVPQQALQRLLWSLPEDDDEAQEATVGTLVAHRALRRAAAARASQLGADEGQVLAAAAAGSPLGTRMLEAAQAHLGAAEDLQSPVGAITGRIEELVEHGLRRPPRACAARATAKEGRMAKEKAKEEGRTPRPRNVVPAWRQNMTTVKRLECEMCHKPFSAGLGRCPACFPPEAAPAPRRASLARATTSDVFQEFLARPAAPVAPGAGGREPSPLPWASATRLLHVGGGSGGVGLVEMPEAGVACLKPQKMCAASELFAARVAASLGVRVAGLRVAAWGDEEFSAIKALIRRAEAYVVPEHLEVMRRSFGRLEFLGILEFVKGISMQGPAVPIAFETLQPKQLRCVWRKVGLLAALDALVNNFDRAPLLWDNDGNTANVLLVISSSEAETEPDVAGIDQAVTPIAPGPGRDKYMDRLKQLADSLFANDEERARLLSQVGQRERVFAETGGQGPGSQWSPAEGLRRVRLAFHVNCGAEVNSAALFEGLRDGLVAIARGWSQGALRADLDGAAEACTCTFASATVEVGLRELAAMGDFVSAAAALVAERASAHGCL